MANFPTLSKLPSDISDKYIDKTIVGEFEGGYEHTRPRHTRNRQQFTVKYLYLKSADKTLLETFWKTTVRGMADSFTWINIKDNTSHTVRFASELDFEFAIDNPDDKYHNLTFSLKDV